MSIAEQSLCMIHRLHRKYKKAPHVNYNKNNVTTTHAPKPRWKSAPITSVPSATSQVQRWRSTPTPSPDVVKPAVPTTCANSRARSAREFPASCQSPEPKAKDINTSCPQKKICIVDQNKSSCPSKKPIDLSVMGPMGPRGLRGPTGSTGPTGPTGPIGPSLSCGPIPYVGPLNINDIVTMGSSSNGSFVSKLVIEDWKWNASIDSSSNSNGTALAIDNCGNIYVAGYGAFNTFPNYYNAGNTTLPADMTGRTGHFDQIFIGKISSAGQWLWNASIDTGDNGNALIPSITTDYCGNIYVSGYGASNTFPNYYNAGNVGPTADMVGRTGVNNQVFLGKLNADGIWLWNASVDSSDNDFNSSITTDRCGNIYIAGYGALNTFPKYYNAGNTGPTADMSGRTGILQQIFIGKINSEGIWKWNASIDSSNYDLIPSITTDNCGNLYIAGYGAANTVPKYYNAGNTGPTADLTGRTGVNTQIFVGKLSSAGIWIWNATVDSNGDDLNPTITTDGYKTLYVTGFIPPNGPPNYYNAGNTGPTPDMIGRTAAVSQFFIGKLSFDGEWKWNASINSNIFYSISSITTDNCGNVYASGYGSAGTSPTYYNAGNTGPTADMTGRVGVFTEIFIGKISSDGKWIWNAAIDSSAQDLYPIVQTDNYGNIYVAGYGAFNTFPKYYNAGNLGPTADMTGRTGIGTQFFIGKLANEARSSRVIGIVKDIQGSNALVDFLGYATTGNLFIAGKDYFIQTTNPLGTSELTTIGCNLCKCSNRYIGTACENNMIILNPEPLSDPKKISCCSD